MANRVRGKTLESTWYTMGIALDRAGALMRDGYCIEIWSPAFLEGHSRSPGRRRTGAAFARAKFRPSELRSRSETACASRPCGKSPRTPEPISTPLELGSGSEGAICVHQTHSNCRDLDHIFASPLRTSRDRQHTGRDLATRVLVPTVTTDTTVQRG